jgi:hypothetical protein
MGQSGERRREAGKAEGFLKPQCRSVKNSGVVKHPKKFFLTTNGRRLIFFAETKPEFSADVAAAKALPVVTKKERLSVLILVSRVDILYPQCKKNQKRVFRLFVLY